MKLTWIVVTLAVTPCAGLLAQPMENAQDKAVQKAIEGGKAYVLKTQKEDGSWEGFIWVPTDQNPTNVAGPTALSLYALMECGLKLDNPAIKKGLEWLEKQKLDKVYSVALRASVWQLAIEMGGDYRQNLQSDVNQLLLAARGGAYSYSCGGEKSKVIVAAKPTWDNSNTNYGLLGIWAGARANLEIPSEFWRQTLDHWLRCQNKDGGWPYSANVAAPTQMTTTSTMTTGAVASLFVCLDNYLFDHYVKCDVPDSEFKQLEKGLAWIDQDIAKNGIAGASGGYTDQYYLYNLERVGLASGRKYFGTSDWYKLGADFLLKSQAANGSWESWVGDNPKHEEILQVLKPRVATPLALLFLVRGQHPVLFNKLQHAGDWNNRPRALAAAMVKLNRDLENSVSWQIINLQVPVSEWHDAPILVITGSKDPKFTDADVDKLREYVQQGGMLFSITECNGKAFTKAMTDPSTGLYKRLFPDYELTPLPADHDLYVKKKTQYDLPGDKLKLAMIYNGIRPLAIHTDVDLTLPLQLKATSNKVFELSTNLARYVSGRVALLPHRGTSSWPVDAKAPTSSSIKVAKLKYTGNYDPEPLAWDRFAIFMAADQAVKVDVSKPMEMSSLTNDYPLAVLTGTASQTFTSEQTDALKKYIAGGGMLFIDAAGGSGDFSKSAEDLVVELCGKGKLKPLALESPLYKPAGAAALAIETVAYTEKGRAMHRDKQRPEPSLRAVVDKDGKIQVIVSRDDVTGGLLGAITKTIAGYTPDSAYRIARNLVLTAKK